MQRPPRIGEITDHRSSVSQLTGEGVASIFERLVSGDELVAQSLANVDRYIYPQPLFENPLRDRIAAALERGVALSKKLGSKSGELLRVDLINKRRIPDEDS